MSRIVRVRLLTALIAILVLAAGGVIWFGTTDVSSFHTRDTTVDVPRTPGSGDRVQLDATLYLPEQSPAPAVLLPHGFGGDKDGMHAEATELAERGLVVLTYSARGFGESTGKIGLNDPDREVADAVELVDYLAQQPDVLRDEDDEPRIGVTGASYGGALALLLAGTDDRIDAIAPVMTYHDLEQALLPNSATTDRVDQSTPVPTASSSAGVLKQAWVGRLFSAGMGAQEEIAPDPDGAESEEGPPNEETHTETDIESTPATDSPSPVDPKTGSCGRFTASVCAAYADIATEGPPEEQTLALLRRVSPRSVLEDITAPTLLVQGENDTLFGLDQAEANARHISEAGAPVSTIWYPGGHDGGSPDAQLRSTIGDFLESHLHNTGAHEQPDFRYDVQGPVRSERTPAVRSLESDAYPGLNSPAVSRQQIALDGPTQSVLRPPGSTPAAISGFPGLGSAGSSAGLAEQLTLEPPGQTARFTSSELSEQLLIAGSTIVRLRISAADGAPDGQEPPDEGVLFAKLYDVDPDGSRTLPGNTVAPIRIPSLPRDGSPVEVTVTLPGIVHSVEAGHRMQLAVSTTDQSYSTPDESTTYQIDLGDDGALAAPVVPGNNVTGGLPLPQLLGIAGTLLTALVIALIAGVRRRRVRTGDVDAAWMDTPIVFEGLTKSYPGGLTAVDDLSFRVEAGTVLGLLGPNGAGKTTTLRMLMGLITPTTGEIRVFGHRVRSGAPVLSRIGSFVEGSGFLPHLSGAANLRLYWAATGRPEEQAALAETLQIAGLGDAVHRKVRTYSQGMRQRLAIAQAMLGLPDLLVLDEPTNGLDPPQIHQMREVLRRYAATGRTVVISSHLLAEVEQTCTRVVVLHHGKLVTTGAVEELVAAEGEATFRVDRPDLAAETLRAMQGISGVRIDDTVVHADLGSTPRSRCIAALVEAGVQVEQAGPRHRLEDAFLQLVTTGEEGG